MSYKKFISLIICLFLFSPLLAINSDAGTKAFTFLKVPIGARSASMGNTYFGLSNDELAPFWNPAGLTQIKTRKFSVTYLNYFVGYNGGSVSYVFPKSDVSSFGFFAKFAGFAGENKTDISSDGQIIELDDTWGSYDVMLGATYAKVMSEILDIGFNLKFISETIDEYSSQAIAGDVAILHQTPNPNLKIGIVAKNLGKQISKFDSKDEELPVVFGGGFRYKITGGNLLLDIKKPMDNDTYGTLGVEKKVRDNLILRAGYKTNASDWKVDSDIDFLSGLSLGFGLNWREFIFDYAVSSYGELGFVHQLTVGREF